MKTWSMLAMCTVSLASIWGCVKTSVNSSAKSHAELTDEQYYAKAEGYLRFFPCFRAGDLTREGAKITVHVRESGMALPLTQCLEPLKLFPSLWDIVQIDETDAIIRISKTTSIEIAGDYLVKNEPQKCVTKVVLTKKGIEFSLAENRNEECKDTLNHLTTWFNVSEQSESKIVLNPITKGFQCATEDKSVTLGLYKDFSVQTTGELFEPISFASYEKKAANGEIGKRTLEHCEYALRLGEVPGSYEGELICSTEDKKIQHKLFVSMMDLKSVLVENGQERQTRCKWPGAGVE
ncbi:MAG: hypothetical protein AB7T49_14540 [Oligoflexales bacterium]